MARIVLISGGSRSGKSSFAQNRAEAKAGKKVFIATCPRIDSEINDRIKRHVLDREGKNWKTEEEQIDLAGSINRYSNSSVILVDCLTLWVNNLLYTCHEDKRDSLEDRVIELCDAVISESRESQAEVIFVTNEVGSGIVPDSKESRLYRDLVGRCNQKIAADADEVILVSCGIPLKLK